MTAASSIKRIDAVEERMTPKELAIRCADENREFKNEIDFGKSLINYSSIEKSPNVRPVFILHKQAENKYPGKKPDDIKNKNSLSRKLRVEYGTLSKMISFPNQVLSGFAECWYLNATLLLSLLENFILKDMYGWRNNSPLSNNIPDLNKQIKLWTAKTTLLFCEILSYDGAIKKIQEKYFNGHPILFRETEATMLSSIKKTEQIISKFNTYLTSTTSSAFTGIKPFHIETLKSACVQPSINSHVDFFVTHAREMATVEILDETGESLSFLWQSLIADIKSLE